MKSPAMNKTMTTNNVTRQPRQPKPRRAGFGCAAICVGCEMTTCVAAWAALVRVVAGEAGLIFGGGEGCRVGGDERAGDVGKGGEGCRDAGFGCRVDGNGGGCGAL